MLTKSRRSDVFIDGLGQVTWLKFLNTPFKDSDISLLIV